LLLQQCRLLLELHLLNFHARRIELLFRHEPLFFGGPQARAQRFLRVARRRERLFRESARPELTLERFLDRGPVDRSALARELRAESLMLRGLGGQ
jgi:hypothetical protein